MKNLTFLAGAALLFSSLATGADAALVINIDTVAQEYFLSGSATGLPNADIDEGTNVVFWDNDEPVSNDGNTHEFLSFDALIISGNSGNSFYMQEHANGHLAGSLSLTSSDLMTITGNSAQRYSYASYSPEIRSDLEGKALDGEILAVTTGSTNFNMQFAAVPEPSSVVLVALGAAFLLKTVRFRRPA